MQLRKWHKRQLNQKKDRTDLCPKCGNHLNKFNKCSVCGYILGDQSFEDQLLSLKNKFVEG